MWYQVSQLSQQSAFCFHVTALWQVPHGHRVILFLFCLFVVVELILSMLVGGNKLLLGACTSLLLLMVFPKLISLSNGCGDTNE
jgi:hypothetical protein